MPIDTSIVNRLRPIATVDVGDLAYKQEQLRGMRQQAVVRDQQIAENKRASQAFDDAQEAAAREARRAQDEEDAYHEHATGATDSSDFLRRMRTDKRVRAKTYMAMETDAAKLRETYAKSHKDELAAQSEIDGKLAGVTASALALDDEQFALAYPQIQAQIREMDPDATLGDQPDRKALGRYRAGIVTGELFAKEAQEKRLADELKIKQQEEARAAKEFDVTLPGKKADAQMKTSVAGFQAKDPGLLTPAERQAATSAEAMRKQADQHHNESLAVQRRGQNMTDARARDAREDRPSTGAEKKALGFYQRAEGALKDLEELQPEIDKLGIIGQAQLNNAPNFAQTDLGKRYNAAARAFTEARLRKDSGAAVPAHEYENDRKTYFPITGDDKQTVADKVRRRGELVEAIRMESGRAYPEYYGGERPNQGNAPKSGPKGDPLGIR